MTLVVTLREPVVTTAERDVDAAHDSLVDHAREFGRLDALARVMRDAGAPEAAVSWTSHRADIAYRAARSEAAAR